MRWGGVGLRARGSGYPLATPLHHVGMGCAMPNPAPQRLTGLQQGRSNRNPRNLTEK